MIKKELEDRAEYFSKVAKKATDREYKQFLIGQAQGIELAIAICEDFLQFTSPEKLKELLQRFEVEKHAGAISENISLNLRGANW